MQTKAASVFGSVPFMWRWLHSGRFSLTKGRWQRSLFTCAEAHPNSAGWSSLVARRAHNPKVVGSNPAPATKSSARSHRWLRAFYFLEQAGFTLDARDRSHTLCEMSGRVRDWLVLGNSSILLHRSTMTALDAVFEAAFFGKEPFKAGLLSH